MQIRGFAILLLSVLFLSGCASNKQTSDSNSMMRKADSDPQIHGEVGAMYGASASKH